MPVLGNIGILYQCKQGGRQAEVQPVEKAALVWERDTIVWVGEEEKLPADYADLEFIDAGGGMVIPGLVDCHTHLAFGGWREDEYELRALGRPYIEIAKSGGGILSSMRATREATEDELYDLALERINGMRKLGITTVECKSGYGLSFKDEVKQLNVYRRLDRNQPLDVVSTFLGAHTIPPEYKDNRAGYISVLIKECIPFIADEQLATFCDIFVEETAFTIDEAWTILSTAQDYGLMLKLHADQLSDGGGASLAADIGAVSADHLEYCSDEGIAKMRDAGVTAVSIPLASYYLRQPSLPARKMIEAGLPVAVSTDFNPGSAPSYHLPFAMHLACVLQTMSPAEVLKGATAYAARALKLDHLTGSLESGKKADIAVMDAKSVNFWLYHFRPNACAMSFKDGIRIV
ncbi:MAG: imidazolonepropionase [Balneolales bacterium]|nr:imidazolonepropionase [Balneolales bacterium]